MRMSDQYYLSQHIYFCDFSDGTIFLDLRTNRYFAMQSHDMLALRPHIHGFSENQDPALQRDEARKVSADAIVRRLLAGGVLTDCAADGKPASPVVLHIDPNSRASESVGRRSPTVLHVLNFLLSLLHASLSIRFSRVGAFLAHHRSARIPRSPSATTQSPPQRVDHLLHIFNHLRLWAYTATDACLLDTLTLAGFLRRYGLMSTVVIGVRTNPFGAHAWGQWNSFVLNDTPDHVRRFRPLLAL
jgi:Transglutaminase-like superfamily